MILTQETEPSTVSRAEGGVGTKDNLRALLAERDQAKLTYATAKARLAECNGKLHGYLQERINLVRQDEQKFDGRVTINAGGMSFKVDKPKRVEWDQKKMRKGIITLKEMGEDISEYVETKHSISEAKWKNWPKAVQAIFEAARTVKHGPESIELVELDK